MKRYATPVIILLLLIAADTYAQKVKLCRDSTHHYEISFPDNWVVVPRYQNTYVLAHRPQKDKSDNKVELTALTEIKDRKATDLNTAYTTALNINKTEPNFITLEKEGLAEDSSYKWFIDTHKNLRTSEVVETMIFIFYHHQRTLMLTCNSYPETFKKYEPVFMKIAATLHFTD